MRAGSCALLIACGGLAPAWAQAKVQPVGGAQPAGGAQPELAEPQPAAAPALPFERQAETSQPTPERDLGTFALTLDNDLFTGSDNNYTHGLGISLITKEISTYRVGHPYRIWDDFWSFLPFMDDPGTVRQAAWTLGQEVFTPDDISLPDPPPDDQPYAGILYLNSTLYATGPRHSHAWNLRLGLVGPSSRAEEAQTEIHEWIGSDEPEGWDHQLPDEMLVNADYNFAYEWLRAGGGDGIEARLVPMSGASLGNYFTGASGALYGELGWNLPEVIGLSTLRRGSSLRPSVDPFAAASAQRNEPPSFSLYGGLGLFAVMHFLPLDGTVFEDSPSVDSEPLVGYGTAGFAFTFRGLALGYSYTYLTDTFEGQVESADYGTLTLAWSY